MGGCNASSSPNLNTSVMLVNVSPAGSIEKRTINSLRYGQMFAGTSAGGVGVAVGGTCNVVSGSSKRAVQKMVAKENNPQGSHVPVSALSKEELQRITLDIQDVYKQHCPEKTEAEVNEILVKFKGREKELLSKVRSKYAPAS